MSSLKVEKERAWKLLKELYYYQEFRDRCHGVEVLDLLKNDEELAEIIDKLLRESIDEG